MCCVAPGCTSGSSRVTRSGGPDECVGLDESDVTFCAGCPTGRRVGELTCNAAAGVAVATLTTSDGPVPTTTRAAGVSVGGAAPVAPAVRVGVDVSACKVPLPFCVGGVVAPEAPVAVGGTGVVVAVSAVSERRYAWVTRILNISDMMLSVASGRIMNCVQTASVHVAYHPNVPLRVVLLFPHGRHLTVSTRTDPHGNATVRARLTYVHADSPVRIGVQASDATAGAQRMESTAVIVALPQACQKAPGATVTIGD